MAQSPLLIFFLGALRVAALWLLRLPQFAGWLRQNLQAEQW